MAKRKARDLSRKAPKREAYKTILIVCEGEKTEKLYFEDLISTENLSSVNVQVYSGRGSDPKSVVDGGGDQDVQTACGKFRHDFGFFGGLHAPVY